MLPRPSSQYRPTFPQFPNRPAASGGAFFLEFLPCEFFTSAAVFFHGDPISIAAQWRYPVTGIELHRMD